MALGDESQSGTNVFAHGDPAIYDQYGNEWTLSRSRQVTVNGEHDRQTANVQMLTYINRRIWQFNDQRLWWSKTGPTDLWQPPGGTPDAPFGPMPDPRIDTIQATLSALAIELTRATNLIAMTIRNLQNDVDEIPREQIPDPRIDTLIHHVTRMAADIAASRTAVAARIYDLMAATVGQNNAVLTAITGLTFGQRGIGERLDTVDAQIHRIIVMLLDLFPRPPPVRRLMIDTSHVSFTSQPAPTKPGP